MTGELIGYVGAPHSTLFDALANFGILGLVTLLALATRAVIAVRRGRGQLLTAFVLGGTALAVNMLRPVGVLLRGGHGLPARPTRLSGKEVLWAGVTIGFDGGALQPTQTAQS